jgi:hypothetical protein
VLTPPAAVRNPRHHRFRVNPLARGPPEAQNQPLPGEHGIGGTHERPGGGQVEDAIGNQPEVSFSNDFARRPDE